MRQDRRSDPTRRLPIPPLPEEITGAELDIEIKHELATLRSASAGTVARHLVMAGQLMDEDPETAWLHAAEARRLAGRVAIVREAAGVAAYNAGHFQEALTEFRAARRMNGAAAYLPVLADCLRGVGRPEKALELLDDGQVGQLTPAERVELVIVAAGAHRDLGDDDQALGLLQSMVEQKRPAGLARLRYAYADLLAQLGETQAAIEYFVLAAEADTDDETDAAERIAELLGTDVTWADDTDSEDDE